MTNNTIQNLSFSIKSTEIISAEIPALERMALNYTGDPADAEDLLQDTLVLALRFWGSYQEGTNLKAWLLKVMRNRYISITRRRKLEKRVLETEERHALADWSIGELGRRNMDRGGGIDRDLGLSDAVVSAMDGLRPEFRQAVWLCDVEEHSYIEAAERASCPVGTIMSRLHRGRRALRKKLVSRQKLNAA